MLTNQPYTTGGPPTVAAEPERQGMVICHIDDLDRMLISAHEQLQKLAMRLQPVIRQAPQAKPIEDQKNPGEPFPLGNRLMDLKHSAQTLYEVLKYLNAHVEI